MPTIVDRFTTLTGTLADLDVGAASFVGLTDSELTAIHTLISGLVREAQKYEALSAAEIAHRSDRALGQAGMSTRFGFVSPEAMIQSLGGGSRAGASKLVTAGTMLSQAKTAAEAAARALEYPDDELLAQAAADTASRVARQTRDRIDSTGIPARAEAKRNRQYWRQWTKPDGMIHGEYELTGDNGASLKDAYDQLLSPRLGGSRFVETGKKAWADALVSDPRSTERIAAESLAELIRLGADADPGRIYGGNKPAVRIVVHRATLDTGHGFGAIEGRPESISRERVEHELCQNGFIPIEFSVDGQALNVGREK